VTKSNDKDPKIDAESAVTADTPDAPESPEPEDDVKNLSKPDWLITTGDEESVDEAAVDAGPEAPEDSSSEKATEEATEQEPVQQSTQQFVPTEVRQPDRMRGAEPYSGGRGGGDTFTRQSEATYVPSEPKIYRAPGSEDDDDEEQFGFPEVPEGTQRLFIAIEIPRALKREFSELSGSFTPREHERVRWIEQDAMHLTLKFLGDIPIEQIPDIEAGLESAAESTGKFSMKIGRTGCFPSFYDPRICWVGFTGELRRLEQLQGRVEGKMVAIGMEQDDRKYAAHVTIGRTRPGIRGRFAEDVGASWQHAPLRSSGNTVQVTSIALYRTSINDQGDTIYDQLGNYSLG
jgi:RNA 2',3'-cyclic 3'-phosphodiesterase